MSYIHDALKASAQQRQALQAGATPPAAAAAAGAPVRRRRWSPGDLTLLLLLTLLLYWFWRDQTSPPQPPPAPVPPADSAQAPAAPATALPAPPAQSAPADEDLSGVRIAVRTPPSAAPPTAVEARPKVEPPPARAPAPVAAVSADPYAGVPYLRQLPVEQQREIGEIRFSVHIYADQPAARMVRYQGQLLREGDRVRPGLIIEAIVPRAVILRQGDSRFRVPAL